LKPSVEMNTPDALVANVVHLISLPNVYTQLEKTLKDPNHTRNDIAAIVNIDPALCARTLRIINSSYYALPKTIYNIGTAINLIGEYDLRNIVLISSVVNSVDALTDNGINITEFWQHSIRCGMIAKLLANTISAPDPELLFLTGLLHDIGQLIIYKNEPELSTTITWHKTEENKQRYQIEQSLLGFGHPIVGALLLEKWSVPEQVSETVKYHHQPDETALYQKEAKIVGLADQLIHFVESNSGLAEIDFEQLPPLISSYLDDLNISNLIIFDLLTEAIDQSQAIENIICTG